MAISKPKQLLLADFLNETIIIINTFHLEFHYNELSLTKDGEEFLTKGYERICLFSITKSKQLNCKLMYYIYSDNYKLDLIFPKQAQLLQKPGVCNKQHLLALMNSKSFQMRDVQKVKRVVQIQIQSLKTFSLDLDEENVCLALQCEEQGALWIFDSSKLEFEEYQDNNSEYNNCITAIGNDSYAYLNNKNKIALYQFSTQSLKEINIIFDKITYISYLKQLQWLAISTIKNDIILLDFKAQKIVGSLKGHQKQINSIAASQNENVLASASDDTLIKLWNIKQKESSEFMQAHQYSISQLAFSEDGQIIASGSIKGLENQVPIFIWDIANRKLITQLIGHQDSICFLSFSYCHKQLYSGSIDGTIIIWNMHYPHQTEIKFVMVELNLTLNSLCFSPKEQVLVGLLNLNDIQKWDIGKIKEQEIKKRRILKINHSLFNSQLNGKGFNQPCNFISDDQFVYNNGNQMITLNVETKKQEIITKFSYEVPIAIQFIPLKDSTNFLYLNERGQLNSLQKNTENKWIEFKSYFEQTKFLFLTPNKKLLFQLRLVEKDDFNFEKSNESSKFQRITIHDFSKLEPSTWKIRSLKQFNGQVSFQEDSKITIIIDQQIQIWDLNNEDYIKIFKGTQKLEVPQISNDQKYLGCIQLYSEKQSDIILWEIENPNIIIELKVSGEQAIIFQFSSNDSNKIYALYKGILRNWNVMNQTFEITNISFDLTASQSYISRNGKFLICQEQEQMDKKIIVWDIKNSKKYFDLTQAPIYALAFSKNDDMFKVAYEDNKKIILKNANTQCLINLINCKKDRSKISFTDNDKKLICLNYDIIYLWQIDESLQHNLIGCWKIYDTYEFKYNSITQEFTYFGMDHIIKVIKIIPTIYKINFDNFDHITDQKRVCFSSDSKYFINLTPYLKIYDVESFQMLVEHKDFQGQQIYAQSNEIVIISNNDQELQLINISKIDKIEKIQKFEHQNQLFQTVSCSDYYFLYFQNEIENKPDNQNYLKQKKAINKLAKLYSNDNSLLAVFYSFQQPIFSMSGKYFALISQQNYEIINFQDCQIFNLEQQLFLDREIKFGQIFFSFNGELIYLFTHNSIQILELQTLNTIQKEILDFEVKEIQNSLNQKYIALMGQDQVKIYQLENQIKFIKTIQSINENENIIKSIFKCISLSPKGDLLLIGEQSPQDFTNSISLWIVEKGEKVYINNQQMMKLKQLDFVQME
ncbi:unnamed protein product [Paramecium sonneborni]|uniref:WD40-repeat-containing domain n=1 Tax=Paramecium sonneborni TaxID=65129 RepID=A0A8S1PD36_9CILI|nr:unnamed protein product [Paramecium sonneborni]